MILGERPAVVRAAIPSPVQGVWSLGPVPVRAYAICIMIGILVAVWLTERRWVRRGGKPGVIVDIATWAVPFGLVGGRLCLGNWFNNEVYGGPTDLPWGCGSTSGTSPRAEPSSARTASPSSWGPSTPRSSTSCCGPSGGAAVVIWADRRYQLGHGRAFGLYVALYTAGRLWTEALRVDPANQILGLRLNIWTSLILGLAATALTVLSARRHPGREQSMLRADAGMPSPAQTR